MKIVANAIQLMWLTRYPHPTEITYNHDTEFMAEFVTIIKIHYSIEPKPIMAHNPQANAIIECVHQML